MSKSTFPEAIGDAPFNDRDTLRQSFTGSWYVAYSTSKVWTDGKQLRPIFKYEPSDGPIGKSLVAPTLALCTANAEEKVSDGVKK